MEKELEQFFSESTWIIILKDEKRFFSLFVIGGLFFSFLGLLYALDKKIDQIYISERIIIGTNPWTGYEVLYLARKEGYLPEGVKLVEYNNTSEVIRAYRNGLLNAMALTIDEALRLVDEGHSIYILFVFDISNGSDAVLSKKKVKGPEDIKGKTIGVEKTALGSYILSRFLSKYGLEEEDVNIKILEVHEHYQAFRKGLVDLIITFEPHKSRILREEGHVVFTSKDIPGEIVDVLVVDRSLEKNKEELRKLVRAYFKAHDHFTKHHEESLGFIAKREKISIFELKTSLDGIIIPNRQENYNLIVGGKLLASIDRVCQYMKAKKAISPGLNCDVLLNLNLMDEVYDYSD